MLTKDLVKLIRYGRVTIHYGKLRETIDTEKDRQALKKYYGCTVVQMSSDALCGIHLWLS